MRRIKINNVGVKGYNFTGYVSIEDLPQDLINVLKIDLSQIDTDEIEVKGEFGVYVSQDEAEVDDVYSLYLIHNDNEVEVSQDDRVNLSQLYNDILEEAASQSDIGQWRSDKLDSIGDDQYDSWKDSQFE
jgi:hypothetical protein